MDFFAAEYGYRNGYEEGKKVGYKIGYEEALKGKGDKLNDDEVEKILTAFIKRLTKLVEENKELLDTLKVIYKNNT